MTEGQLGAPVHGATHPSRSSRPRWLSVTCGLAVAACSAALLAYAELGRFSRYVADDFCTAGILRDYSFLGAQRYWYLNWSGRYSFTLAITALERLFGLPIVPLLPALVLALWLGVAIWAIREIRALAGQPCPVLAAVAWALVIVFATLRTAPNLKQSFYWQTGIMTYCMPLLLATLYAGASCRWARTRTGRSAGSLSWAMVLSAGLSFVAGGFAETYATMQAAALGIAVLAVWSSKGGRFRNVRSALLPILLAGLAGSLLAIAVEALAPGTQVRRDTFSPAGDFFAVVILAVGSSFGYVLALLRDSAGVGLLAALCMSALIALYAAPGFGAEPTHSPGTLARSLLTSGAAGFALVACSFATVIYTTWNLPPSRARILLAFVLTLVAVHWGATLAAPAARVMWRPDGTPRRAALVVSLVLLLFIVQAPIGAISWALEQRAAFAAYALGWDQMDNSLRNASLQGLREVTIATPRYGSGLEDLGPDPHHAVNRCAAWYYGLRSIVAR